MKLSTWLANRAVVELPPKDGWRLWKTNKWHPAFWASRLLCAISQGRA